LADIRSKLAKRSKQNVVLRAFHAKNDSQTIASWRADLNRILLVFNVRSVFPAQPPLTVQLQTELGLNIYTTVSNIQDGVTKTSTVAENTQAMVSDIHGKLLGSQVSNVQSIPTTEYMLTVTRIKPGQHARLLIDQGSHVCI